MPGCIDRVYPVIFGREGQGNVWYWARMRERLLKLFPAHVELALPPSYQPKTGGLNLWPSVLLFVGIGLLAVLALYLNSFSQVP